jgi:hypothetical protein
MDEIGKDIKTILDQNNPVSKQKINVHCGENRKVTIHVPRALRSDLANSQ